MAVVEDVTDRIRAAQALQAARAELARITRLTTMGELAASIAHEVNQPLFGVISNASASMRWLERDEPNVDEVRQSLQRIIRDANRAADVIKSVRALAKQSQPELHSLYINDIVQEVLALLRGELHAREVSVQNDLSADLPPIIADKVQLQQVVLNLVMNGIEAMDAVDARDRTLLVRSHLNEPGQISVAVEDSGVGVDEKTAAHMFDPFFTTKPDGMGMGLAICRSIIEEYGGTLSARSRSPCGTIIEFSLPLSREDVS
jgi:C4-dicarboxylate-specific signal transduction histidine kinase